MQPTHKTRRSAGADLHASENITVNAHATAIVKTGAYVPHTLEDDVFLMLALRSSLAVKGIMLANGVGVIDADFPNEIGVILYNTNAHDFVINIGDRIAQLIPVRYVLGVFPVDYNERVGGFGSTNS